jgi:hypothetical protein
VSIILIYLTEDKTFGVFARNVLLAWHVFAKDIDDPTQYGETLPATNNISEYIPEEYESSDDGEDTSRITPLECSEIYKLGSVSTIRYISLSMMESIALHSGKVVSTLINQAAQVGCIIEANGGWTMTQKFMLMMEDAIASDMTDEIIETFIWESWV